MHSNWTSGYGSRSEILWQRLTTGWRAVLCCAVLRGMACAARCEHAAHVLDMYVLMETRVPVVLRCVWPKPTTRARMHMCVCVLCVVAMCSWQRWASITL